MKKNNFKDRVHYWFDNRMSKGLSNLVLMLIVSTFVFVLLIAVLITLLDFDEGTGFLYALWDSFASVINNCMPNAGDYSAGYIFFMAVSTIVGILFTSVLIGIITTAIEEKIMDLHNGKGIVLEKDHIVVLGFTTGTYELINQICLATLSKTKRCILVVGDEEQSEIEDNIKENVDIPDNVRIICRSLNVYDPVELKMCSIPDSSRVIICGPDDKDVLRTILAVTKLLENEDSNTLIVASVSKKSSVEPCRLASNNKAVIIQTQSIISRIIAHSCTQAGISRTFTNIFSFAGPDLYIKNIPELTNKKFSEIVTSVENDIPLGIYHNEVSILNPDKNTILDKDDSLILISRSFDKPILDFSKINSLEDVDFNYVHTKEHDDVTVIGYNPNFDKIAKELNETNHKITIANVNECYMEHVKHLKELDSTADITIYEGSLDTNEELQSIIKTCRHIVLLSDNDVDPDESDATVIMLLLRLREIKRKNNRHYSITTELKTEANKELIQDNDLTDFIVSTDMAAMMVSQCSEDPRLIPIFKELLSNDGNELYLMSAYKFVEVDKEYSVDELRKAAMKHNCLYIGIKTNDDVNLHLDADDIIHIDISDKLIVLAK